jgi:hypothetical protein
MYTNISVLQIDHFKINVFSNATKMKLRVGGCRRFEGKFYLRTQAQGLNKAKLCPLLISSLLDPEDGSNTFPRLVSFDYDTAERYIPSDKSQ